MRMDRAIKHASVRLYDRDEIEVIRQQLYQLAVQYRNSHQLDRVSTNAKRRVPS